ncbi:hypothetical protein B9T19_02655 [Ignatzschineria sp. F8392]|nr:hypothetical protein B9T19_02655 [Ignatzschineria sp. F8392]
MKYLHGRWRGREGLFVVAEREQQGSQPIEIRHYWDEFLAGSERILFLQGPIGPYFFHLATHLEQAGGKRCYKINFNGGDLYYYPLKNRRKGATWNYSGSVSQFKESLKAHLIDEKIDTVVCFGDERIYHQIARDLVHELNQEGITPALTFWAFEEGYLRPHYITFEKWGVNYNSRINRNTESYRQFTDFTEVDDLEKDLNKGVVPVAAGFWRRAKIAMRYYKAMRDQRRQFPHYRHHRETRLHVYAYAWLLAGWRNLRYRRRDHQIAKAMEEGRYGDFFLFPLQVHNDSQIIQHGRGKRVPEYIRQVIASFGQYAKPEDRLVIKHHPMDRGFNHYGALIERLAKRYKVEDRVDYLFEIPMPILLRATKGVVVVNSTSGLSALIHNLPVKVIGDAHYDNPYLTNQCSLGAFWQQCRAPNSQYVKRYLYALKFKSQMNGSFYYEEQLMMPAVKFSDSDSKF